MQDDSDLEAVIRARCEDGDRGRAATLVIEGYGPEIMAFLRARLASRGTAADEVFSMFAEKLWTGLPGFEWRCSMRSWAYRLARNAANDYMAAAGNRPERNLPLSQHAPPSNLLERGRTTTAAYRRTGPKDRMRELRETLPLDDQMLLILRVDRGLDWRELAAAMSDGDAPISAERLDREAARLRKRFERVKHQLRQLAQAHGLL